MNFFKGNFYWKKLKDEYDCKDFNWSISERLTKASCVWKRRWPQLTVGRGVWRWGWPGRPCCQTRCSAWPRTCRSDGPGTQEDTGTPTRPSRPPRTDHCSGKDRLGAGAAQAQTLHRQRTNFRLYNTLQAKNISLTSLLLSTFQV